ncbi:hypothetical protein [uncultured Selenomonas sp.]|uniref:hypothetical protein n=1 Tax=uncultured Selenomonas sp. TaxID=159275 RepID=UPI0028EE1236|nr:hypothetical protein [uncultured Selenomonas sp.]
MLGAHFGFKAKETGSVACNVVGFLATSKFGAQLAAGHHDSRFNFDEKALVYAAKMLAASGASILLGK